MKKIMILGASYSQLPLYHAAKRLGIHTIAVSTPGDWPGFGAADVSSYTDISCPEAVLEAAKKHRIDGITTCCLDTGVKAIGYVCENLGLKGISAQAGLVSTDKYLMKEAFRKHGVRCARHVCVSSQEQLEKAMEELRFPVIVKAVDLMGSRGIFRCNTKEEVRFYYKESMAATRKDYCLIEEFIEGQVLGCEAMVCDGEFLYCLPNNIDAYQSHVPTPVGHSVPYRKQVLLGAEVQRQVGLAVRAAGLDNCPVNCDLIEKDNEIYVIEITARAGATCLPETVGLYFGIDYYEAIVRLALGMQPEEMFKGNPLCRPNLSKIITSDKAGIVNHIENGNEPSPDIIDISFNISRGDEVRRYENGRDRLGQIILAGDTLKVCETRLEEVLSKISIEIVP